MDAFFLFLGEYELPIYLILLLMGLFAFRWLWLSWREWRQAYFSLEREIAMRRLARNTIFAAVVVIFACGQTIIASFIVPGMPASARIGTPTVDLLGGVAPEGTTSGAVAVTTPGAASPALGSEGCAVDKVEIKSPKPGDTVSGVINIVGTVDVPNFGFYKYEFAAVGSDLWATISADRKMVKNDTLGTWNTGTLIPGEYQLRLVVTDTQGQPLPACVISVRVVAQ